MSYSGSQNSGRVELADPTLHSSPGNHSPSHIPEPQIFEGSTSAALSLGFLRSDLPRLPSSCDTAPFSRGQSPLDIPRIVDVLSYDWHRIQHSKGLFVFSYCYCNCNKFASLVGGNHQCEWKKMCRNNSIKENKRNINKKIIIPLHI